MSKRPRNILIFANPISGSGRGLRIADGLAGAARAAGHQVAVYLSHPSQAPAEVIPAGRDAVVVAIGGDGTLRCVVERLLAASSEHPAHAAVPPIVTVPLGTANLVATHLGCKWKRGHIGDQIMHAISADHRRPFDVTAVDGKAMLAVLGVGFDAHVVHDLCARRKGPITYADYALPVVRSILAYRFPPISIRVDGKPAVTDTQAIAFVGNIPEYGGGFSVTPKAKSNDRLLDVCILPCRNWQHLFELGAICGVGLHIGTERAIYHRGKHVEISASERVPVQIDGDEGGFTPVTLDLLPRQLTFIVPPVQEHS
jgi:diacylglycerol kinase family enzyme